MIQAQSLEWSNLLNNQVNTRSVILDTLMEINENGRFTHIILNNALNKYQYLERQDRAFISRVVRGSVERKITLDYVIDIFSKVKVNKMKPVIRNIMRMSVYQMMYMDSIAEFAICNEAVKLAGKRGFSSLKGFVNGVLRNIARNISTVEFPKKEDNAVRFLSVKYSMPEWIIDNWLKTYDIETVENILESQHEDRTLTIRCNSTLISPKDLADRLINQGITVKQSEILPEAMEISGYDYLDKIAEFNEGFFCVQDISSMLVCHAAGVHKENYVIDVCAAPGGKSTHIAEMLQNTGMVDARDVSEEKTALIEENAARLHLLNVKVNVKDARITDEDTKGKADIVIADLPCSGLGIIGKKPDIKYHVTEAGCKELVQLQREILLAASEYVKSGGTLIYSTCTINKQENVENAQWFEANSDFRHDSLVPFLPKQLQNNSTAEDGYIQILPSKEFDGFFISRFVKQ